MLSDHHHPSASAPFPYSFCLSSEIFFNWAYKISQEGFKIKNILSHAATEGWNETRSSVIVKFVQIGILI